MGTLIQMAGQRYGRLLVVRRDGQLGGKAAWVCLCACGRNAIISGKSLRSGATRSCGCLIGESARERFTKHGWSGTRARQVWEAMIARCHNQKSSSYHRYGGRGIFVCGEWRQSFFSFLEDMGEPLEGMTLERGENNGAYCKSNCHWATRKEQASNRRTNRWLTCRGVTRTLTQWAEDRGMHKATLATRLRIGWSLERALNFSQVLTRNRRMK